MIVLKIIGWFFLSLFAIITVALCVKVVVGVEYSDKKTEAYLKYLFLRIPLYPAKKKEKDKATDTPEQTPTPPDVLPDGQTGEQANGEASTAPAGKQSTADLLKLLYEAEGIDGLIEIVKRASSYLGKFMSGLLHAFIVEQFDLEVCCAKKDAAKTAIYYGEVCSQIFPLLGAIASACTVKDYNINVYPDFLARYSDAAFRLRFHVVPIRLVGISLALVLKLVFKVALGLIIKIVRASRKPDGQKQPQGNTNNPQNNTNNSQSNTNNTEKSEVTNE